MEPNRDIDALVDEIDSALASLQKKSAKKIVRVSYAPTFPCSLYTAPSTPHTPHPTHVSAPISLLSP